ncbi:MAG: hypothetical protein DPW09_03395 [Anaerolineae bacterium]|nr:DUF4331 family protein [Anaerolineales bacterium]MCQ3972476.1 hypothetical protein [Anaerolineae bacterium]
MSDHFSGPRAITDPAADIADLYVFPSPERPDCLVLVLTVFPAAMPGALFSDAVAYRFRLRPATLRPAGSGPLFEVAQTEYSFTCTFAAPVKRDGSEAWVQTGACTTPAGVVISFRVNDEQGTEAPGLRVFAGLRLDPFFIDLPGVQATEKLRRLAFKLEGNNTLEDQNVLTIVVEVETALMFGENGPIFAVAGETMTTGTVPIRLERIGRPEIKNVVMSSKEFDPVNRDLEIRDLYNQEDPFRLAQPYVGAYRARLNANLAFFDGLDGKTDWPLDEQGNHPLTELLLADFLVADVSKPYSEDSCFEIEQALLKGITPQTCGGRSLNDDIVDSLYTLLVNGGNGPRIRDGVDQATRPAARTFPYLISPNPNPPDLRARAAAAMAQPKAVA